jgi:hypothetical protein
MYPDGVAGCTGAVGSVTFNASIGIDSPHHASKQMAGQMALRQQQPVAPRVLYQPGARLHQSLLQPRQRPVANPVWQHQPPEIPKVVSYHAQAQAHLAGPEPGVSLGPLDGLPN